MALNLPSYIGCINLHATVAKIQMEGSLVLISRQTPTAGPKVPRPRCCTTKAPPRELEPKSTKMIWVLQKGT